MTENLEYINGQWNGKDSQELDRFLCDQEK
jgi:hypothetical protein